MIQFPQDASQRVSRRSHALPSQIKAMVATAVAEEIKPAHLNLTAISPAPPPSTNSASSRNPRTTFDELRDRSKSPQLGPNR